MPCSVTMRASPWPNWLRACCSGSSNLVGQFRRRRLTLQPQFVILRVGADKYVRAGREAVSGWTTCVVEHAARRNPGEPEAGEPYARIVGRDLETERHATVSALCPTALISLLTRPAWGGRPGYDRTRLFSV